MARGATTTFLPRLCLFAVWAMACSGLPKRASRQGAPKITYSKETEIMSGEPAVLDCEVKNVDLSGLKDFRIRWSKVEEAEDGTQSVVNLSSNQDIVVESEDLSRYEVVHPENTYRYSLKMANVNEKDAGLYRCTVVFGPNQEIDADIPLKVLHQAYFSDVTLKTVRVAEGDALSIDCQPGGYPKPDVYWEKVGEELPYYGGKYFRANEFEMPIIERIHRGKYRCFADNGLGSPASSEVFIEVQYQPSVELSSEKLAASVFDEINIVCRSQGFPMPQMRWTKNGEKIVEGSNLQIHTHTEEADEKIVSKLHIREIQPDEFSDYSCIAENELGTTQKSFRIELKTPPSIEKQTEGEKIYETGTDERGRNDLPIALECIGSGVPTPTYRWMKDGKVLLWQADPRMSIELGTGTLLISEPTPNDNGVYQCLAFNELGMAVSDEIRLTESTVLGFVHEEPPKDTYEAEFGKPFRLRCPRATGYPKPELTWMKERRVADGFEMMYIDDERMVVDDEGTLWFSHVLDEDDSFKNNFKYVCLASTELHPYDLNIAKQLSIRVLPPADKGWNLEHEHINIETFLMHSSPDHVNFKTNQKHELWCIFGGEPIPEVIWLRTDGVELSTDKYAVKNHGQTLVFLDTQLDMAGEYICVANNEIGETKKKRIIVEVEVVPQFKKDFKEQAQVVEEGTPVTFSCGILEERVAKPKYEWFFNSRPIKENDISNRWVEGANLIISAASVSDIGNYACKASNDVGYVFGQTTLNVIPKRPSSLVKYTSRNTHLESLQQRFAELSQNVKTSFQEMSQEQAQVKVEIQAISTLVERIAEKLQIPKVQREAEPEPQTDVQTEAEPQADVQTEVQTEAGIETDTAAETNTAAEETTEQYRFGLIDMETE